MLGRAVDPGVSCFCGSERCVRILTFLCAPLRTPFSRDYVHPPSPNKHTRFLSALRCLQFSSPSLSGPVAVLLGNSNPGKRSGLWFWPPQVLGLWRPRPRAAVLALLLGLPEGIVGRLEETPGTYFSCWCVRIIPDITLVIHLVCE